LNILCRQGNLRSVSPSEQQSLRARLPELVVAAFGVAMAAWLAWRGPDLGPIPNDSLEYISHSPIRGALYPLFLDICRLIFRGAGLHVAVFLQGAAIVAAALWFGRVLARLYGLPALYGAAAAAIALIPLPRHGRMVLPDALCYALFLVVLADAAHLQRSMTRLRRLRPFAIGVAMVLLRPQFLFALGGLSLAWAARTVRERSWRDAARTAAVAIAIVIGGVLLQAGHHLWKSGRASGTPYTGMQLLTVFVYLADEADVQALPDEDAGKLVRASWQRARARNLLVSQKAKGYPTAYHFHESYNEICWGSIVTAWSEGWRGKTFDFRQGGANTFTIDELFALDKLSLRGVRLLLPRLKGRYAMYIGKSLWQDAGLLTPVLAALGLLAAWTWWRTRSLRWGYLAFVIAMWFGNAVLVASLESLVFDRYDLYTNVTVVVVLLASIASFASREPCAESPAS
jgi:hypothetical protein